MGALIDETGNRYGMLTVLGRATNKGSIIRWVSECDCGNFSRPRGQTLRKGEARSCGCIVGGNNSLSSGQAMFNCLFRQYESSANKRGLDFELSKDLLLSLTKEDCYYCGEKPSNIFAHKRNNGTYVYNGVDRLDNTKGYVEGNVVACCKECNFAKQTSSVEEFLSMVERIYEKHIRSRL